MAANPPPASPAPAPLFPAVNAPPAADGGRHRPSRHTRSELTPRLRAILAGLAVAAGVGAALASAAPTGWGAVDWIERAAFAMVMVVAGSRARRWALVFASSVVALGAAGAAAGFGVAALVCASVLVLTDRRERYIGAAVGGLVALGSMHLAVEWFSGASLVVGLAVCGPILASGYTNSMRTVRRRWRLAAIAALGLVILIAGVAAVASLAARGDLTAAVSKTQAAIGSIDGGEAADAAAELESAAEGYGRARDRLDSVWTYPARLVPVLSQNLSAVREVAASGASLATSASRSAAEVDYDLLRKPDGGIDLAVLRSFREPVVQTAAALARAAEVAQENSSMWVIGPIADRLEDFGAEVRGLRKSADVAAAAVDHVPALLGEQAPRRYLVLLGNPAEARDLGGHIGNWAELVADKGKLELIEVGRPLDLVTTRGADELADQESYPVSLLEMRPSGFPQNWGSAPDLPTVARMAGELFNAKTGRTIDGVMYADPEAFAAFLSLTGPVDVPGLDPPLQLAPEDAARFLQTDQYRLFPDDNAGNEALTAVIRTVFDSLTSVQLPGPRRLGELFAPLVDEGRFQVASLHEEDGDFLDRMNLSGRVVVESGRDMLGVLTRNANPSKIDAFLKRSTEVRINWNPRTGEVGSTVTVTMRNEAPAAGLSPTVIGNGLGLPLGTNVTDLAVITPFRLLRIRVDGVIASGRPLWDGRFSRHEVRLTLAPGATQVVTFELTGLVKPGAVYEMDSIGQPLVNDGVRTVVVVPTAGSVTDPSKLAADTRDEMLRFELKS